MSTLGKRWAKRIDEAKAAWRRFFASRPPALRLHARANEKNPDLIEWYDDDGDLRRITTVNQHLK